MSAKRKPRLPVLVRPKPLGKGDEFSDRVTLGTTTYIVEAYPFAGQGEKPEDNPEIDIVMSGRSPQRQPFDFYHPPNPKNIMELNPGIKLIPLGHKECINCGEFVKKDKFSPDKRARDGLHSWCKSCRNEQARRIYWHEKNTAIGIAA